MTATPSQEPAAPRRAAVASRSGREPDAAVRAVDAAVRLGGRTIWEDLSFVVPPASFTAILGPNGIGKSTLLRAIAGLQPLAAGQLRVFGHPPRRARPHLGYLPQRRGLDPALRVRGVDLVRLGLDGDRWGVPLPGRLSRSGRAAHRRVAEAVELAGATGYATRPVGRLSGGEQQRLLLAQAMVRRPELLLLDEPLDSLDLANQAAMAALLRRICRDEQVTVVLVAHDVNPMLASLDRVIYLGRRGAVSGTVDEVVTSTALTGLYQTPVEVLRTRDGRLVVVGEPEAPGDHLDRHGGGWRDG